MNYKTAILAIGLVFSLSSCSMLADKVLSAALPGDSAGIDVSANVGKVEGETAQQAETAVAISPKTTNNETIEGSVGTIVNESGLSFWELILLVLFAGWAIPSPKEMLDGLISSIRRLFGRE